MIGDVSAVAAFVHGGAASVLVRNLKYRRCERSGMILAEAMSARLRPDTVVAVPIPRAVSRRIVHGIDPAAELARGIHRLTGIPVLELLQAPLIWPRHAGRSRSRRQSVPFVATHAPQGHLVLVDDVITTGATALGGAQAIRAAGRRTWGESGAPTVSVLAATSPGTMGRGARTSHEEVA
jgi:predicted amidophosphoribosyltransferase